MKPGTVAVAAIAIALVVGGLFFGLGGLSSDDGVADSVPRATLPPNTVAPPAPAVVGTEAGATPAPSETPATFPEGTETLPVPNVIGTSRATAEARLTDFVVEVTTVPATDSDFLDAVSAQSPEAAERLPAGETVTITLSIQPVPETIPADPIPAGEFSTVDLVALEPGDCGNGALVGDELVYELVECDEFHDLQLITRFDVADAPGEFDALALDELVREQCQQPFEDFVGLDPSDSTLFLLTIRPNDVRYVSEGERTSLCAAVPLGAVRVRGSAEASLW